MACWSNIINRPLTLPYSVVYFTKLVSWRWRIEKSKRKNYAASSQEWKPLPTLTKVDDRWPMWNARRAWHWMQATLLMTTNWKWHTTTLNRGVDKGAFWLNSEECKNSPATRLYCPWEKRKKLFISKLAHLWSQSLILTMKQESWIQATCLEK